MIPLPVRGFTLFMIGMGAWSPVLRGGEAPAGNVVSDREIERALSAEPRTRSLTRGITIKPREEAARQEAGGEASGEATVETTEPYKAIDLSIPFELNSARLQPTAVEQLRQLQSALQSAALRSSRFLIAGHTDATGNAAYNRELSFRRAEAVTQFLVAAGIEPGRLETTGFGAAQLLRPAEPASAANRRVEIRNLGERR